jgi:hypothetical protein
MDDHLRHEPIDVAHALLRRRDADTPGGVRDVDRSGWDYRMLRATQNPLLRQSRSLIGALRRRRATARLR